MNSEIIKIFDLIDWSNSYENQKNGIELAKKLNNITPFFQPTLKKYSKNVWDNCAVIISDRSDDELQKYLSLMFEWLKDLNWPGAFEIFERLKKIPYVLYKNELYDSIQEALKQNNYSWLKNLCELLDDSKLKKFYFDLINNS